MIIGKGQNAQFFLVTILPIFFFFIGNKIVNNLTQSFYHSNTQYQAILRKLLIEYLINVVNPTYKYYDHDEIIMIVKSPLKGACVLQTLCHVPVCGLENFFFRMNLCLK